jgi:formate dehydrogenase subunit beta
MSKKMDDIEKKIREEARRLLVERKVDIFIGYGPGYDETHPMPTFIEAEDEVERLVYNEYCVFNLTRYLVEMDEDKKVGLVVKGCDSRSLIVLLQENKLKREQLIVVGVPCEGIKDQDSHEILKKCKVCRYHQPVISDITMGTIEEKEPEGDPYQEVAELEKKSSEERWNYWSEELARCIRCYACRKICPLCYCDPCFVDQTQPQWVEKSIKPSANLNFHLTRAFHLAGRCVDCGECERACPMGISLRNLNKKLEKECESLFKQIAGVDPEEKPALITLSKTDPDEIMR